MDDAKTVFIGNLSPEVTEELLYELFLQAGPLERVKIPADRNGRKSNFGFVTFKHECSVAYASQLLNGTKLFDKGLSVKPRNSNNGPNMQRNVSYTDAHMSPTMKHHKRFDGSQDMDHLNVSYEDLLHMGQQLNYNSPQNHPRNDHRDRNRYRNDYHHDYDNDKRERDYSAGRKKSFDRQNQHRDGGRRNHRYY